MNGGRTRAKDAAAKKAGLDKPAAILAKYPLPSPEVFVAAIIPEAVYGMYVCIQIVYMYTGLGGWLLKTDLSD